MCGGLPHLVDSLRSLIQTGFEIWIDVQGGVLHNEQAQVILNQIVAASEQLYGANRWQALLHNKEDR